MSPFGINLPNPHEAGSCPQCDGDGYLDIVNDDGGVDGPMPCPKCNATGDAGYVECPGGGMDDLCAQAHGHDPFTDGCGLCTLGSSV